MKNKNLIKALLIALIIIILGYIIYKSFFLIKLNDKEIFDNIKLNMSKEIINIENKEVLDYEDFDGYKIRNDFEGYKKEGNFLVEDNGDKAFAMGTDTDFYTYLTTTNFVDTSIYEELSSKKEELSFFKKILNNVSTIINNEKIYSKDIKKYFKKNNIKNDYDIIKHVSEGIDYNIFTSISDLKAINSIKNFYKIAMFDFEEANYIDGDYKGIMYKISDTVYYVEIMINNEKLFITYIDKSDSKNKTEELTQLISTIKY